MVFVVFEDQDLPVFQRRHVKHGLAHFPSVPQADEDLIPEASLAGGYNVEVYPDLVAGGQWTPPGFRSRGFPGLYTAPR
jgi:hypothetical protein